ncbi:CHRD domain-containing protein [Larkinella arboricola]
MKRTFAYLMTAFLATALAVTSCSPIKDAPDKKDTVEFEGALAGNWVLPSNGSSATGTFTGTYNKVTKSLSYTVNYTGLTPTSGSINLAPGGPGTNGSSILTFTSLTNPISGTISNMTQTQENALIEGRMYVTLGTTQYPAGEIRGNIMRAPINND